MLDWPKMSAMKNDPISSLQEIQEVSGRRARLAGVYQQVDLRQKPRPPAVFAGQVALVLDDGAAVYMEPSWSEVALRSSEERSQFEGRRVVVTGVVWAEMPEPPEPLAHVLGPCVSPVEKIEPY